MILVAQLDLVLRPAFSSWNGSRHYYRAQIVGIPWWTGISKYLSSHSVCWHAWPKNSEQSTMAWFITGRSLFMLFAFVILTFIVRWIFDGEFAGNWVFEKHLHISTLRCAWEGKNKWETFSSFFCCTSVTSSSEWPSEGREG